MVATYNQSGETYNDLDFLYDGAYIATLYARPEYRVQVFKFDGTANFGIGALIAEFENAKYVGYADYINDVPEAFWTINQGDTKLSSVLSYLGKAHVRILRNNEIVWTGWLMDSDETEDDVVFYCYGYTAGLFWNTTSWAQTFSNQTIGAIVSSLWTYVKTTLTKSTLGFVQTGSIQAPVTTTGGTTPIVLSKWQGFLTIVLHAFQQLAAFASSNTSHSVVFEITHSAKPTFNFWKDWGVQRKHATLEYGGNVLSFRRRRSLVYRRNDVHAVGAAPHDIVLRDQQSDATDMSETGGGWGRRTGASFFSWVLDQAELQRATKRRLALAKRVDVDLALETKPNAIIPPGAPGSAMRLADRVPVKIKKGLTQINGTYFQLVGHQTIAMRGVEMVNLMLQEPL